MDEPRRALISLAVLRAPEVAAAHVELAARLHAIGRSEAALRWLARALALAPLDAGLHLLFADLTARMGAVRRGVAALRRSLCLEPAQSAALRALARHEQTLDPAADSGAAARALLVAPEEAENWTARYRALWVRPEVGPEQLLGALAAMTRALGARAPGIARSFPNVPDPDRPLRVGHVLGPYACAHTHAMIFEPLLHAYDRRAIEVYCYADAPVGGPDRVTESLMAAGAWRDTDGLDADAFARCVADDRIDILCDCYGLGDARRLAPFAARLAPLQARLDNVGSTGLAATDYLLADAETETALLVADAVERLAIVPHAYSLRPLAPVRLPLARRDGPPVLGSTNQLVKLSGATLAMWADVMRVLPGARLLLKARELASSDVRAAWRAHLARFGVAPERVDLRPWTPTYQEHLASYAEIDIALDSFPYGGATTTFEALITGVPVITRRGAAVCGRYAAMMLRAAGHPEWIADDADGYVRRVAELAADVDRLRAERPRFANAIARSALADSRAYAASIERVFRAMWRRWCAGEPPARIDATAST